jgi:hypothetical protein
MVFYRSPVSARERLENATPKQREANLEAWRAWAARVGYAIADLGSPLTHTVHVGPGAASADGVVGYSVLEAGSADEIGTILDDHPHLATPGGSIEILEVIPMADL